MRRWVRPALAYGAVGVALWPLPVFGVLHAESSAVVAAAAFVIAGVAAIRDVRDGEGLPRMMGRHLGLLLIPLALLTVSLLWRANCAWWTGLGLFGLLVPPSALLGVALAYALTGTATRWPRAWLVGIGLAVAVGGVLADLAVHPQLFTYNHVFGGVLGPIYDEELAVRPGLWVFRGLTLLWAVALVLTGHALRSGWTRRLAGVWTAVVLTIGAAYLMAVPLGFQQSHRALARALGARVEAGPFAIHYDASATDAETLRRISDELRYRYDQIERRLGTAPADPIRVYLYPDREVKGRLIGSRETSVVPVWLPSPQIHMLADEVARSAGHELVHVFARGFGMPGLRASPAVGLVEGLAVALEPPDGLPPPQDVVRAALAASVDAAGLEQDPAAVVEATMGPLGFWTTRAGVAYTANGAFVEWLLQRSGGEPLREAYRTGRFQTAYGETLASLAAEWARSLDDAEASPEAVALAQDLLTRRSLFERTCPHAVPGFLRAAREGEAALDEGETARAAERYADALRDEPTFEAALAGWSAALAAQGRIPDADSLRRQAARSLDSLAGPLAHQALADLNRLGGRDAEADRLYEVAMARMPSYASTQAAVLHRRAQLLPHALEAILASPGNPAEAARAAEADAPVFAALLWDAAGRPSEAWRVAQTWPDTPGATPRDRAALLTLQSRLAYWSGDLERAEFLATTASDAFEGLGLKGPSALAEDLAARARWRQSSGRFEAAVPFHPAP